MVILPISLLRSRSLISSRPRMLAYIDEILPRSTSQRLYSALTGLWKRFDVKSHVHFAWSSRQYLMCSSYHFLSSDFCPAHGSAVDANTSFVTRGSLLVAQ